MLPLLRSGRCHQQVKRRPFEPFPPYGGHGKSDNKTACCPIDAIQIAIHAQRAISLKMDVAASRCWTASPRSGFNSSPPVMWRRGATKNCYPAKRSGGGQTESHGVRRGQLHCQGRRRCKTFLSFKFEVIPPREHAIGLSRPFSPSQFHLRICFLDLFRHALRVGSHMIDP